MGPFVSKPYTFAKEMDITFVVSISFCMSRATNPRRAERAVGRVAERSQCKIQRNGEGASN